MQTPQPHALSRGVDDASHHSEGEPVLDIHEIQGNILAGFNKDFQILITLEILDVAIFKEWLNDQISFIATTAEVLEFNKLFKKLKSRRNGMEGTLKSTWFNIAFDFEGVKLLTGNADFNDEAFTNGLAKRAISELNDPIDTTAEGNPNKWVLGGPNNGKTHVLLVIASDSRELMLQEVLRIQETINIMSVNRPIAKITYKEEGGTLPAPLTGHEHFGFQDGVSQPGVRGTLSNDPNDVLTLRQNPLDDGQGKPGQDLLWPGEFIFGYQGQTPDKEIAEPGDVKREKEEWTKNGSFLVFRRLRQDVFGFHSFLKKTGDQMQQSGKFNAPLNSSLPRLIGAKMVGRWPSGAPVMRTPGDDNYTLGNDDCASNHFEYNGDDQAIKPSDRRTELDCVDNQYGDVIKADIAGLKCPFAGHIRKAYPRNDAERKLEVCDNTDSSGFSKEEDEKHAIDPEGINERTTQTHRMLRRGIPFGAVSPSSFDSPVKDKISRGLFFISYQTSIQNQFEFVSKNWVNNKDFKDEGAGHDLILGQTNENNRVRSAKIKFTNNAGEVICQDIVTEDANGNGIDFVIPTGGGYFFSPSISALETIFSKK